MSAPGKQLMPLFMNRFPRAFLSATLAGIGYLPKDQRKGYVDHVLHTPDALTFMNGLLGTVSPYSQRVQGNRNDLQQVAPSKRCHST
jgi:hypothetical protein